MSQLKINRTESAIRVQSPYSPDLPAAAKQLSGRWDRAESEWVFPLEIEAEVKSLYMNVYGEWDDQPQETVTLMCCNGNTDFKHSFEKSSITLGGRVIARAYGRDSGAKTANGVVLISGKFESGGSVKNWKTEATNVTFKLLDVPVKKAQELIDNPEWCEKIEIIQKEVSNR